MVKFFEYQCLYVCLLNAKLKHKESKSRLLNNLGAFSYLWHSFEPIMYGFVLMFENIYSNVYCIWHKEEMFKVKREHNFLKEIKNLF